MAPTNEQRDLPWFKALVRSELSELQGLSAITQADRAPVQLD